MGPALGIYTPSQNRFFCINAPIQFNLMFGLSSPSFLRLMALARRVRLSFCGGGGGGPFPGDLSFACDAIDDSSLIERDSLSISFSLSLSLSLSLALMRSMIERPRWARQPRERGLSQIVSIKKCGVPPPL